MIRRLLLAAACTLIALAVAGVGPLPATAKDLGVQGALFPINETDIMAFLAARLQAAKASGKADQLNRAFAARAKQSLMRPPAVERIGHDPVTADLAVRSRPTSCPRTSPTRTAVCSPTPDRW